jgi:hypothetical protein
LNFAWETLIIMFPDLSREGVLPLDNALLQLKNNSSQADLHSESHCCPESRLASSCPPLSRAFASTCKSRRCMRLFRWQWLPVLFSAASPSQFQVLPKDTLVQFTISLWREGMTECDLAVPLRTRVLEKNRSYSATYLLITRQHQH